MTSTEKPAPQKISLVTTQRDELFAIGRLIAEGIEPQLLQDPMKPIIVSIRGSLSSGKSIVAQEGRKTLFSGGEKESVLSVGEIWTDTKSGIEVDYLDSAYGDNKDTVPFLKLRKAGGVTYIQNDENCSAAIEVWIENHRRIVGVNDCRHRVGTSSISETYNYFSFAPWETWARYVEVNVLNEDLAKSDRFQRSLTEIAALHHVFDAAATPAEPVQNHVRKPSVFVRAAQFARELFTLQSSSRGSWGPPV